MNGRQKKIIIFIILIWFVVLILFLFYLNKSDKSKFYTIAFLDVGQGDSVLISSPDGFQVLYDGGADYSVLSELSKLMPRFDREIEMVIASHADLDHIGGLPFVMDRYRVNKFIWTGDASESTADDVLLKKIEEKNIETIIARSGMKIDIPSGIKIEILHPDIITTNSENNAVSVVAKIKIGNIGTLLTGDIPIGVEQNLINKYPEILQSEILKLAHHGSNNSSSEEFLMAVKPTYSIISAGKENKYGHPHKEVVERAEKYSDKIKSTAIDGTLIFKTDGEILVSQ